MFRKKLTLARFQALGQPLHPIKAYLLARHFTASLLPMAQYDIAPLLWPENIIINDDTMILKDEKPSKKYLENPPLTPGYAAPECAAQRSPATPVYFVGAALYCLCTGTPPPPAEQRTPNATLVPPRATLHALINGATALAVAQRIGNLYQLYDALAAAEQKIYLENK